MLSWKTSREIHLERSMCIASARCGRLKCTCRLKQGSCGMCSRRCDEGERCAATSVTSPARRLDVSLSRVRDPIMCHVRNRMAAASECRISSWRARCTERGCRTRAWTMTQSASAMAAGDIVHSPIRLGQQVRPRHPDVDTIKGRATRPQELPMSTADMGGTRGES